MSIEKQFYIRLDYIPHHEDTPEQDGTYKIIGKDEIDDRIMNKDSRIVSCAGTPASDPYFECVVDSFLLAEHIEKYIIDVLTRYKCRVIK